MSLPVRIITFVLFTFLYSGLLAFDQFEAFRENGKYGVINKETREVVVKPEYDAVGWSDATFSVFNNTIGLKQNEKWALASMDGSKITAHQYTILYPFRDNLLIAGLRSRFSILNKFGVITVRGKVAVGLQYDQLTPVADQLIAGKLTQGQYRFGLLSKNGKGIIQQKYLSINAVEQEIVSVKNDEGFSAIFSTTGQQLSPFEFEDIAPYDEKNLLVTYYNRKGLVDKTGKVTTPPIYKDIRLEGGKTKVLPFKKWTLFGQEFNGDKAFFFDKVLPIDADNFAIQTSGNVGVITIEEAYKTYMQNLQLVSVKHKLLIVSNGEYQGIMDTRGNFVLPMNYDKVEIREKVIFGQIRRRDKQDWQTFNHRGVLQSNHRYESFFAVSDHRIGAVRNGKSGLLDQNGNEVTPFIYDDLLPMVGNKMVVHYQGNQGVINDRGHWIITPYKDSLAIYDSFVYYQQGTQSGTIDFSDRVIFNTQKKLRLLNNRLFISQDQDGYQVLDYQGQPLTKNHYDSIYSIHNDLLALKKSDSHWLFRPSTGEKIRTPPNTELLGIYAEDRIAAKIDGQWGFISEQARLRIANRYEAVDHFSEGLAAVKLIGKWGIINRQEELIIQPSYSHIAPFYAGLSLVEQNDFTGMIDKKGHLVLELQYNKIERFDNYIIVNSGGLLGLADKRGNLIRSPQYESVQTSDGQNFIVSKGGRFGVVSLSGEDKVPVAFENIEAFGQLYLVGEPSEWITLPVK
ncbi:MAG: WG repeat-containing protein [Roseivirga sp.]|nr:WG repeat-containing protein [Roseivirga sp.]